MNYSINYLADILSVSEKTIKSWIKKEKLKIYKDKSTNKIFITNDSLNKFLEKNKRYANIFYSNSTIQKEDAKDKINSNLKELLFNNLKINFDDFINFTPTLIKDATVSKETLKSLSDLKLLFNIKYQDSISSIIFQLKNMIDIDCHPDLSCGDILKSEQIKEIFNRAPSHERINFSKKTKELFVITRIGSDNIAIKDFNSISYYKDGKIFFEGKGYDTQVFKSSNLHLYKRYLLNTSNIENPLKYIHVFNCISPTDILCKDYIYLGKFFVSDWKLNVNRNHKFDPLKNKHSIIYTITPLSKSNSKIIDSYYK